ncbi:hypothetical protein [Alcaligenes faecalis]|uniref:hypothetical protein n=1 Tax=Alcaligenes faecalis TaxID=511 RepID=UPI00129409AA|nr:hypothetical protein [Alcaligenes faecalis]
MKLKKLAFKWVVGAALLGPTLALAYPTAPLTVTVKNLGSVPIELKRINSGDNIAIDYGVPTPQTFIAPASSDTYTIAFSYELERLIVFLPYQGKGPYPSSPDKKCGFRAVHQYPLNPLAPHPAPTVSVLGSEGGATCTATVTSYNPITHAWAIEVTMQ